MSRNLQSSQQSEASLNRESKQQELATRQNDLQDQWDPTPKEMVDFKLLRRVLRERNESGSSRELSPSAHDSSFQGLSDDQYQKGLDLL